MDNFMDKLAQRLTAQEMIKANSEADAAELERLQKQLDQYDACLQEMRKLSLKNSDTTDKINTLLDESISKIQTISSSVSTAMDGIVDKTNDFVHKENVKVYRNVQAVILEEAKKQTEALEAAQKKSAGLSKAAIVLSAITLLTVLANLAWNLLLYFGIL